MPRDTRLKATLTASLLAVTVASCAGAQERTLIAQFFAASRLRDLTALQSIASVVFEPTTDGIVGDFEVLSISPAHASDAAKDVQITAPVRMPDGRTVVKTFVVTLQRGLPNSDQRWGGWMITAIKAGPAALSTPRS